MEYMLAFLLPFVGLTIILFLLKIWPFGDASLAFWDANSQYVDFLSYLKDVLEGRQSWTYSFSRTLGGGTLTLLGYYLFSPFNLLVLFFEKAQMAEAFTLIYVIKLCFAGVTCRYYLKRYAQKSAVLLGCSTAYALCAYCFAYGFNIMWLDAVIALPLMAAGLDRVLKGQSPLLYLLSLFYGLISCYYTGYMLCGFSVIYFFSFWMSDRNWKIMFRYLTASVLAAGLAAAVLVPVFVALGDSEAQQTAFFMTGKRNFLLGDWLRQLVMGNFSLSDLTDTAIPQMFCGIAVYYGAFHYFTDRRQKKTQKIQIAAVLLILVISVYFYMPDIVWHGFSQPYGAPYRYSFMISFVLVRCAAQWLQQEISAQGDAKYRLDWEGIVLCLLLVWTGISQKAEMKYVLVSLLILFVLIGGRIAEAKFIRGRGRVLLLLCVMFLLVVDVFHNGKLTWGKLVNHDAVSVSSYQNYADAANKLLEEFSGADFYRMEINYSARRNYNDAMLLGYNGVSHYASAESLAVADWLETVGVSGWHEAETGSVVLDSVLGIKYRISGTAMDDYIEIIRSEDGVVYENPFVWPLLWAGKAEIALAKEPKANGAELLNQMAAAYGIALDKVFKEAQVNLLPAETAQTNRYQIMIDSSDDLFVAVNREENGEFPYVEVYVDGVRKGFYTAEYSQTLINLGNFPLGSSVEVETVGGEVQFYYQNLNALAENSAADVGGITKKEYGGGVLLSLNMELEEDEMICSSIPYDLGWRIRVNGIETEAVETFGGFLAFHGEIGNNQIEMYYWPAGLSAGLSISAVSLLIILLWQGYMFKMTKRKDRQII